jgi:vancomycin resistance protein VanW
MRGYSTRTCWSILILAVIGCLLGLPTSSIHKQRPTQALPPHLLARKSVVADSSELPWQYDLDFHSATKRRQTPATLAACRLVLEEPIAQESYNVALAAQRLKGITVAAGAVFSLNESLGPYTEERGFLPGPNYVGGQVVMGVGGGVCKIATALYNLTVLSDLPVIQRKAHTMVVPYVPPGQDATVSLAAQVDYKFRNNTPRPILIWAQVTDDTLYMAFYGERSGPTVQWRHKVISHTPATIVRRLNPELKAGEERELSPGYDGYCVRSWAEITYADGQTKTRHLGVSCYTMAPEIIEYGPET